MPIDTRILSVCRRRFCSLALGVELLELLLLERSRLGELNAHRVGGELLVGIGHGLNLVLNEHLVEGVEEDLLGVAGDLANTSTASDNGGRNDDIVESGGVHGLEGAGARALLALMSDLSLGVNGPVDDDNNVARELLLKVVDHGAGDLPVELKGAEGDLDHDVLGGRAIISLVGLLSDRVDEKRAELLLDVLAGLLKSGEGLGGVLLELSRLDLCDKRLPVNRCNRFYLRPPSSEAWSC